MSVPVLTFFNNKGGVGKTSLVFHLAWMLSEMGKRVVAIDLDPQANLTSAFLPEDDLEILWDPDDSPVAEEFDSYSEPQGYEPRPFRWVTRWLSKLLPWRS